MDTTETKRGKRRVSMSLFWGAGNEDAVLKGVVANVNSTKGEITNDGTITSRTNAINRGNPISEERPSFRRFAKYLLSNDQTDRQPVSMDGSGSITNTSGNRCIFPTQGRHIKSSMGNTIYKMMDSNVIEDFEQMNLVKRPARNPLQKNENILNNFVKYPPVNRGYISSRVIALTNINIRMSMGNLLTQVYGGPLERIETHNRGNYQMITPSLVFKSHTSTNTPTDWSAIDILLYFHKHEDAQDFYDYSKTGMFIVNGTHLDSHWVHYEEDIGDEREVLDKMENTNEKARRVLVFKKPVSNKRHRTAYERRHWPDPISHFTKDFNYEQVRSDFEKYGGLVEVMPVISRKTCFGVQFMDVRTAMKVKHIIQANSEDYPRFSDSPEMDATLHEKYKDWYVWFGTDPCDKAVVI